MIEKLSFLPNVKGVFAIGTVLAIELKDIGGGGKVFKNFNYNYLI